MSTVLLQSLTYDTHSIYNNYLFSANLTPLTILTPQSPICLLFIITPQAQNYYSLLHPFLYLALLYALVSLEFTYLAILSSFVMLGSIWAFFYNDVFWGFDIVEVVVSILLFLSLLKYHKFFSLSVLTYLSLLVLIVFKFQTIDSFHTFSNSIQVNPTPNISLRTWFVSFFGIFYTKYNYRVRKRYMFFINPPLKLNMYHL